MQVGRIREGKFEVDDPVVVIFVAIVGIIPAFVTACTQTVLQPVAQYSTRQLEAKKLDAERDKLAADVYRKVLSHPDATKRQELIRFLITAKVIEDEGEVIASLPPEQVPHWPESP